MESCFQSQLASIIQALANAAVSEISALVDGGFTSLRLEVSRCHRENLALRSKLRLQELQTSNRLSKTGLSTPPLGANCSRRGHRAAAQTVSLHSAEELSEEEVLVVVKEEVLEEVQAAGHRAASQTVSLHSAEELSEEEVLVVVKEEVLEEVQAAVDFQSLAAESGLHLVSSAPSLNLNPEPPRILLSDGFQAAVRGPPPGRQQGGPPVGFQEEEAPRQERRQTERRRRDWRRHPGGKAPVKTEGGGAFPPWALSPAPGQEDDPSLSGNMMTNHISLSPHGHHTDNQSVEGKPGQLDFDSASFDELFSSPEVASSLKAPPSDPAEFNFLYRSPAPSSEPLADATSSHLPLSQSWGRAVPADPERPLKCRFCGRMFFSPRDLLVHQRSHSGERIYHCPLCKKPFAHLHQLKTHQRVHTGEKPYSCTQCGRRFSQSSHIKRHMSVHTGERRYSCALCGKRFSQSYSLKVHQAVHTGEKPYSCTQCGKRFSVLGNLVRHQSVHVRK